jgi:predicted amidohydrolase YtcJ
MLKLFPFFLVYLICTNTCLAQKIYFNGKVSLGENQFAQAFVIKENRFVFVGTNTEALEFKNSSSTVFDLRGKTVIPGLIDSHIHAIRAGLGFKHEISLFGIRSIKEALFKIKNESKRLARGQWIIIAGGWSESQFIEKRGFTQKELLSVANGHPFYVQLNYSKILLSPNAINELNLSNQVELLSNLMVETRDDGRQTGWYLGSSRTISRVFDLLPKPTFDDQLKGSIQFFDELIKHGVTGVIDPGGYNLPLDSYRAIFKLNNHDQIKLRIRFHVCAPSAKSELNDFSEIVTNPNFRVNSKFLKFNGIGENVNWAMYNNENPTEEQKNEMYQILDWANQNQFPVTIHWNHNQSVHHLLEVIERVNSRTSIQPLRWSIAHLMNASEQSLERMRLLGVGWLVQNAFYLNGSVFVKQNGLAESLSVPRVQFAKKSGVQIGAGTDAHRVMGFSPFQSLQWLIDGKTIEGTQLGDKLERPNRWTALALYTQGSAWFSFEENERGQIKNGFLADAVILDKDYFTIPVDQIGSIKPVLTLIDGQIIYQR